MVDAVTPGVSALVFHSNEDAAPGTGVHPSAPSRFPGGELLGADGLGCGERG